MIVDVGCCAGVVGRSKAPDSSHFVASLEETSAAFRRLQDRNIRQLFGKEPYRHQRSRRDDRATMCWYLDLVSTAPKGSTWVLTSKILSLVIDVEEPPINRSNRSCSAFKVGGLHKLDRSRRTPNESESRDGRGEYRPYAEEVHDGCVEKDERSA